jgi:hypothetical protein
VRGCNLPFYILSKRYGYRHPNASTRFGAAAAMATSVALSVRDRSARRGATNLVGMQQCAKIHEARISWSATCASRRQVLDLQLMPLAPSPSFPAISLRLAALPPARRLEVLHGTA